MMKLQQLIANKLIDANTEIVWKHHGQNETATILVDGTIKTSDGKIHKTPSGAARSLNSNKPIDGWLAWKIQGTKTSLSEIRAKASIN